MCTEKKVHSDAWVCVQISRSTSVDKFVTDEMDMDQHIGEMWCTAKKNVTVSNTSVEKVNGYI